MVDGRKALKKYIVYYKIWIQAQIPFQGECYLCLKVIKSGESRKKEVTRKVNRSVKASRALVELANPSR